MSAGVVFFFFSELGRPPMRPLYEQQDLQHLMLKELITCLDLHKPTCASKWHEESLISLCSQSRFSVGDGVFCSYKIPFYVFLKELSV